MGFFFRKRLSIGPLGLNLSKSGIGLSLGVRGFRLGLSSSGRRYVSASIPGSGLYLRSYAHHPRHQTVAPGTPFALPHLVSGDPAPHGLCYALGYAIGWLLILSPFAWLTWYVLQHYHR